VGTLIVVLLVLAVFAAGGVMAWRITRKTRDAVDRVRVRAQIAQTKLMPSGPRRDAALLRQRLDAQVRAARAVLGAPDGRVFRADAPTVLAEITASATELDTALASISRMTESQQREALQAITPQVDGLITTTDTACRTLLRTRAETRSGQLAALADGIDFEAASLETYERDRNDLSL
jgi:hypothetical protein